MKVLFVITGLGVGGAERVVVQLADQLLKLGYVVKIVYLTGEARMLPSDPRVQLQGLNITSVSGMIKGFFCLRGIIKEYSPDIVHAHMFHSNIITRFLRFFVNIRFLINTAHNKVEGAKYRSLLYRVTDGLADVFTNVSDEAVREFRRVGADPKNRMEVVYNGISTDKFAFRADARAQVIEEFCLNQDSKILVSVGSLSKQKDYFNLFRALELLCEDGKDFRSLIVGDGPERSNLESYVYNGPLKDKVIFCGVREDVDRIISSADVFILPSAWEGFGLVVAEAMACERTVVATDCGGVREVLGDCGFLVPPCDSLSLYSSLKNAISLDVFPAKKSGKIARQRVVENYSEKRSLKRWLTIYERSSEKVS